MHAKEHKNIHIASFLDIYYIGDTMKRRRYKRKRYIARNHKSGNYPVVCYKSRRALRLTGSGMDFRFFVYLCLFVLLSFGYKEDIFYMIFPQTLYIYEDELKQNIKPTELVFAFVDGGYGYFLSERKDLLLKKETKETDLAECDENQSAKEYLLDEFGRDGISDSEVNSSIDDGDYVNQGNDVPYIQDVYEGLSSENQQAMEDLLEKENQNAIIQDNQSFIKQETPVFAPNYDDLKDFTYLKQHYYTVDSTTSITSERLDINKFMAFDPKIKQDNTQPQILIYHTHSQEGFADSTQDPSTTIVGVGDLLTQILRDEYGFNVIHDTGTYDVPNRDYAYSVSAPAIEKILAENPSIEVIIDLHRDGVANDTHLVKEIGGRQTAQFMFFNGISYLNATGPIDYLENPYIDQNLAFSFRMKLAADQYYPGFARNIYLKGLRYNMHYREKSLLIEVGAQTNTVSEAMNAAEPIAQILAMVLNGEVN